ncbi:MAG: hypothetical protein HUU21_00075 [Polyangiaceae bacterium]|nr:hypothetical protein [Polyangiaceae bacterium]NUQ71960.1 hypothetical protein [Polyangiaceae bacterium]
MEGRIHCSPLGVTSDGTVVANLAQLETVEDIQEAVQRALQSGRVVFIGVALTQEEVAFLLRRLDDSGADALAWVLGKTHAKARLQNDNDQDAPNPDADQDVWRKAPRKSRTTDS